MANLPAGGWSQRHRQLHSRYKPDDNAAEVAIPAARRRYPPANHAAEALVIYDLQRTDADQQPTPASQGKSPSER